MSGSPLRVSAHSAFTVCFAALVLLACSNESTGRLGIARDSVFLYGAGDSELAHHLGIPSDSLSNQIMLTSRHPAFVSASGGWVKCMREGSSVVEARAGSLVDSIVVVCRIATKLAAEQYFELEPDSRPVDLSATATMPSGEAIRLQPLAASTDDSSVAVVVDGMLMPRGVGHSPIRIDYGGVRHRSRVVVQRTVFDGLLTLRPGESRQWPLDDGRYSITVKVASRDDLNRLNMETEGLNCSRDGRDEDTIHCVTTQRAQVTILNRGKGIGAVTAREADARVRIRQIQ